MVSRCDLADSAESCSWLRRLGWSRRGCPNTYGRRRPEMRRTSCGTASVPGTERWGAPSSLGRTASPRRSGILRRRCRRRARSSGGSLERRNLDLFAFSTLGGQHVGDRWGAGLTLVVSELYDVYIASGGLRAGSPLSIGAAAKSYQFGVLGDRGSGLGLDLGARSRLGVEGATVSIGIVTRDVGWTSIRWGALETLAVDRVAWGSRAAVAVATNLAGAEWVVEADAELASRRPPSNDETDYWENVGEANVSLRMAFRWFGIAVRAGIQRFDVLNQVRTCGRRSASASKSARSPATSRSSLPPWGSPTRQGRGGVVGLVTVPPAFVRSARGRSQRPDRRLWSVRRSTGPGALQ